MTTPYDDDRPEHLSLDETYQFIQLVESLQDLPSCVPWWVRLFEDKNPVLLFRSCPSAVMVDQLTVSRRKADLFGAAKIAGLHMKWLGFNTTLTELCIKKHGILAAFLVAKK